MTDRITSNENAITVLTPVYINTPERFNYFQTAIESFKACCLFSGRIYHHVIDDGSPLCSAEIVEYCSKSNLTFLGRIERDSRRGFFEILQKLYASVKTRYCVYLEPDHYFYLPYDFITPITRLYEIVPDLHQVYLRAPLEYRQFFLKDEFLITHDKTILFRIRIDEQNTGWVGRGRNHESFSFMPGVFKTETIAEYFLNSFIPGDRPSDIEPTLARHWAFRHITGYLNAQAFCYHIGAAGSEGQGGYLKLPDSRYESVWSNKIL